MANRRYQSQFVQSFETQQVLLDCNFIVDSTNGNGLGIRSLKGAGIAAVYMQTSATPSALNPMGSASAPGLIYVQLQDCYRRYLAGFSGFVDALSGTNIAVDSTLLTIGQVYVITVLGTTTAADWLALGLPAGVVPAVGLPFIAKATGHGSGSGQVQTSQSSGAYDIELVGDPNLSTAAMAKLPQANIQPIGQVVGGYLICRIMGPTSTSNPTPIPVAPPNNTVIGLSMLLSNSSVQILGQ
jgi:hypothetical protein